MSSLHGQRRGSSSRGSRRARPILCRMTCSMLPRRRLTVRCARRSAPSGSASAPPTCPATSTVWPTALRMAACMWGPSSATSACSRQQPHAACTPRARSSWRRSLMPSSRAQQSHLLLHGSVTCLQLSAAARRLLSALRSCWLTTPLCGSPARPACSSCGPTCGSPSWPACGGCAASARSRTARSARTRSPWLSCARSARPSSGTGPAPHATSPGWMHPTASGSEGETRPWTWSSLRIVGCMAASSALCSSPRPVVRRSCSCASHRQRPCLCPWRSMPPPPRSSE